MAFSICTPVTPRQAVRTWIDENTGREIRQLTDDPVGASLGYFRIPRHMPDGSTLAWGSTLLRIDAESGQVTHGPAVVGRALRFRERDGLLWTVSRRDRQVWANWLPTGESERVVALPADLPGQIQDITCDGGTLILAEAHQDLKTTPIPTTRDLDAFWRYIYRPRHGKLWAWNIHTHKLTLLSQQPDACFSHVDTHVTDPTLIRFTIDRWDGYHQRVWTIRTDGSDLRPIRPQQFGELVTHEFWWSDHDHIGFTYQDRRIDQQQYEFPWAEYAPAKTQLGIADLGGQQVYLSDPVNHYHTHLYRSFNGKLVSGSGTDGHSFVYAAAFDWHSTRIDFVPLATIHTPYVPFRGQHVNCDFTADGRWLLYTDTVQGTLQLCAVKVDL